MSDITDRYRDLNHILNRDSTNTTYKYALLRGIVEVCESFPHLRRDIDDHAEYPMGLLVERWLLYYYPLMASETFIPQQKGEKVEGTRHPRIRNGFDPIIEHYRDIGGFAAFAADLERGDMPDGIRHDLIRLLVNIRQTISDMPMRHLGKSLNGEHYSIVRYDGRDARRITSEPIDRKTMIDHLGTFTIDGSLADAFEMIGPLITGSGSILNAWAETTISMDHSGGLDKGTVLTMLVEIPEASRSTHEARGLYEGLIRTEGSIECVWTGKSISEPSGFDVDHVLPYSKWRNNDIWNLLPASSEANRRKRDLVPDPRLVERRGDLITDYWRVADSECRDRFRRQVSASLTAVDFEGDWCDDALRALVNRCYYLSESRGEVTWSPCIE